MARNTKQVPVSSSALGAFEEAKSEIESLRDEMSEWRDNMDIGGLGHTDKYMQVEEAHDNLDSACNELDSVEFPGETGDASVTYTETRPYGKKPQPRWMRLSNAMAALEAAKCSLEEAQDNANIDAPACSCDNPPEDSEEFGDDHELDCPLYRDADAEEPEEPDFESPLSYFEEAESYLQSVDFPGMY